MGYLMDNDFAYNPATRRGVFMGKPFCVLLPHEEPGDGSSLMLTLGVHEADDYAVAPTTLGSGTFYTQSVRCVYVNYTVPDGGIWIAQVQPKKRISVPDFIGSSLAVMIALYQSHVEKIISENRK